MNNNFKRNAQGGFTLIELIVVIVILGILAATALPKFINLGADAREASMRGAKGALGSAAALVHSRWLMTGGTTVTVDGGTSIAVNTNGFPTNASILVAAGIDASDYTIAPNDGAGTVLVSPRGVTTAASCGATYTAATGIVTLPATIACN